MHKEPKAQPAAKYFAIASVIVTLAIVIGSFALPTSKAACNQTGGPTSLVDFAGLALIALVPLLSGIAFWLYHSGRPWWGKLLGGIGIGLLLLVIIAVSSAVAGIQQCGIDPGGF